MFFAHVHVCVGAIACGNDCQRRGGSVRWKTTSITPSGG